VGVGACVGTSVAETLGSLGTGDACGAGAQPAISTLATKIKLSKDQSFFFIYICGSFLFSFAVIDQILIDNLHNKLATSLGLLSFFICRVV
jgi:hypothetical protein